MTAWLFILWWAKEFSLEDFTMSEEGVSTGSDDVMASTEGDGEKRGRTPQSVRKHGKGRAASRGRISNNNRRLASAQGRHSPGTGSSLGYSGPHGNDQKYASSKDDQGCQLEDKARCTMKQIDHDEKEELFGEQDAVPESQQGVCYQPTKIKAEALGRKQTATPPKKDMANGSSRTRGKTVKISMDKSRGKGSKRNNSLGTRGLRGYPSGNSEFTPICYDSQEFHDDLAMQERDFHKSKISTNMDFLSSVGQPYFNCSEHKYRSNKLDIPDGSQKGQKGVTFVRPTGKRGNIRDYKKQKEEVLRTLSYLNPLQSSQASVLIEQLRNETYECMVCCERIRCSAAVWSCCSCYHLFHLGCVRKWAKSSVATLPEGDEIGGWRCPGCQNITQEIPTVYKCFCGKVVAPEWRRHEGLTPHSCGEICGKQRDSLCQHRCNQLCHPGPCPSCPVMITKACSCGKTKNHIRCGQATVILCDQVCSKILNCLTHRCTRICHQGPCEDCKIVVQQICYCGKQHREALCGTGEPGNEDLEGKSGCFSCQEKCLRTLDCGNHYCQTVCHVGVCKECLLKPSILTICPCGKTPLFDLLGGHDVRKSCLDPVPTCQLICGKVLPCSPLKDLSQGRGSIKTKEHCCKMRCHLGGCGPCDGRRKIKCRCGTNTKEILCSDLNSEEYTCDQRCNKKRKCGRHRCNKKCCGDVEHKCELICGKKLRCGLHQCLESCHPGYCPPCLMSGFDELKCYCGATVLYPPIPCGTSPPECEKPCSRIHACHHPVNHTCHSDEICPPCTMLTNKKCMGDHEVRHNIPCHVNDVSCGKECGKLLNCGHKCRKICHRPPCLSDDEPCLHPCELPRKDCGHPCVAACHSGKQCPAISCKVKVTVKCKCGRRSEKLPCLQGGEKTAVTQAYQRLATETLANKMKDLQSGQSIDISSIMKADDKKLRQLECNSDCRVYERNRRLAEALDIENADLSQEVSFRFSPFLWTEARQNLKFAKSVEEALENLVQTTLKSTTSQRTHSFPPMASNQRRLIHELAVFYNCATRSYDQEPKRNTVVTATKESRLPSARLSSQIEREINPPPPQPIPFLPSTQESSKKLVMDLIHVKFV
ncbi:Transcriptional repressor NF-X1 [Stylophora pistillata]|uniref:Transcriptional repressor NF-X1 n=1 Tax=Stylophora pistillata TaxID=50429 RepID=A0A2B4S8E0_STYPI|nr:Transcriptional repressor NF-X1 [Stylophora pistillata]